MKKTLSLILVFALMLTLCACGGSGKSYAAAEKQLADGDYAAAAEAFAALGDYKDSAEKAQEAYLKDAVSYVWISDGIKLTDEAIKDMFAQSASLVEDGNAEIYQEAIDSCEFSTAEYSMCLEFKEDGTFVYYPEEDSFNAAMNSVFGDFMNGFVAYFIGTLNDMFSAYGMSMDDLLDMYEAADETEFVELIMGMTTEEMVEGLVEEIGTAEYKESCTFNGTYSIEGGKLQIMLDDAADTGRYDAANGTLVFDGEGVDPESLPFDGIYPMVFRHA